MFSSRLFSFLLFISSRFSPCSPMLFPLRLQSTGKSPKQQKAKSGSFEKIIKISHFFQEKPKKSKKKSRKEREVALGAPSPSLYFNFFWPHFTSLHFTSPLHCVFF